MGLNRAARWLVEGICGWELAALTTGLVPSVSEVAWRTRRNPLALAVWSGLIGWLSWHLLVEGR